MANQEGVKIVITAEDRFTENIKKIEASTKIFGETAKNTEKHLAALEKEMIRLVANGMDPANAKIKEMKANYDKLSQSLDSGGGSLKESNKKWNALSLIVQDLPFGFRAIQNNLPALVGSFAAAGGAIYLAFSVAIALATAFEKELTSLFSTVTQADRMQKTYNASIEAGQKAYTDAKTQVMLLNEQVKEAAGNKQKEKKAVDDYNDTIGKTLGHLNTFKEVQQSLINQGDAYVNFIFKVNMANAAAAKVAEESANMMIAAYKDPSKFISTWDKVFSAQINIFGDMTAAAIGTAEELAKRGKENQQAAIKDAGLNAVAAEKVWNTLKKQVEDAKKELKFGSFADPKEAKKTAEQQQKVNEQVIQNLIDAKKQEVKLVEDDAFRKYEVSKELAQLEMKLALEKIKNSEYTTKQQVALQEGVYKEYANKLVLLDQATQEQILAQDEKVRKEKKRRDERDFKEQEQFGKSQVDVIKSELGVKLKLNKDNLIGQQEAVKQSMAKVGALMVAAFGTGQFGPLLQFYDELNAKLEGMDQKALRGADAMKKVNSIISDTATNALVQFGENLGKAFAGENVDIFGGFLDLLAGGLQAIGSALIAYGFAMDAFKKAFNDPYLAIAAGVALVAAGSFLKSKISKVSSTGGASAGNIPAFANGGIVSGPTMGLMGEYPGAKSNPEVIAPLDKLKDMLGGGQGGTFVLRGQDLLLSVNRAQKASNIKGQTISLA